MQAGADQYQSEQYVPLELYQRLQEDTSQKILLLEQQLAELKRLIYGSKSERYVSEQTGQLALFEQQPQEARPATEQITYERKKKKDKKHPLRLALPAHLPRVEEVIEPPNVPEGAKKIGQEITEQLEYNPANIFVRKIIRPKYAVGGTIKISDLPPLPLPKTNAGASMLSHIAVSKFVDHLPLYRLVQIFKRQGLHISDSTLGGWTSAVSDLLEALYLELARQTLDTDYLQMDESPIGVQDSHKRGALHTGYQWVVHNPVKRLVLFKYARGRGGGTPAAMLAGYTGALQTDGYQVYETIGKHHSVTMLGCLAHGRRYFEKALDNDKSRAGYAMEQIQQLYAMERKIRERNTDTRVIKRYRQMYASPILKKMEDWMKQQQLHVLPKSAIGKAIAYNLNVWTNIRRYTEDGRYQIDNNLIENTIRPLALGRKNYLFAGSHHSAQNIAMFYSFFASCKVNDVNPQQWLTYVLTNIKETKRSQLHTLLPRAFKNGLNA